MTRQETKLGDCIDTLKGYAFKSQWYSDNGVPLVKVSNFTEDSIDISGLVFIPEDIARTYSKYQLKPDDIVIQTVGSWATNPQSVVGKVIKVPNRANNALLNQNAVKLLPKSFVDNRYLFYRLKSSDFKNYIIGCGQGAASQASITLDSIRAFNFQLPPIEEQRRIAAILSAYNELIENNTQRIQILEEMSQRVYKEWFVHFRFPGYESVRFVESQLGPIPQGWSVAKLEEVCKRITDGSHSSPTSVETGKPMASVKDMHDWGINLSSCRRISDDDFERLVRNDCKPRKNDVLIAKDGSYLKHTFVIDEEIDLVILSSIAILRPNENINPNLLALYLKQPEIKQRMKGFVSGAALPRIILQDFRQFKTLVPPIELQNEWTKLAEPMLNSCRSLVRKNEVLKRTRDLLLPKLISGEIDVSNFPDPYEL